MKDRTTEYCFSISTTGETHAQGGTFAEMAFSGVNTCPLHGWPRSNKLPELRQQLPDQLHEVLRAAATPLLGLFFGSSKQDLAAAQALLEEAFQAAEVHFNAFLQSLKYVSYRRHACILRKAGVQEV